MFSHFTHTSIFRSIAVMVIVAFVTMIPAQSGYAQVLMQMPQPGTMVNQTARFDPALMTGLRVDVKNPFNFYFIMDKGQANMSEDVAKEEYNKLIKYFLASLTIPNKDMWVNLSPLEASRIIPDNFSETEMGRDLLAQDYLLKQFTASLMYPEGKVGQEFWSKVYAQAYSAFGTTDIPIDTFNKVWITAGEADIYQKDDTAFLYNSRLKVMLEQDFMAIDQNKEQFGADTDVSESDEARKIASDIVREVVIPIIEKEVNEGESFAQVRQVYQSMIMATWFKKTLRESLLGQVYADKDKVAGIRVDDPQAKEKIYQQYLEAYKVGVFNYIKEEMDPASREMLPRKYFSGGNDTAQAVQKVITTTENMAVVSEKVARAQKAGKRGFGTALVIVGALLLGQVATAFAGNTQNQPTQDDPNVEPTAFVQFAAPADTVQTASVSMTEIQDKVRADVQAYADSLDTAHQRLLNMKQKGRAYRKAARSFGKMQLNLQNMVNDARELGVTFSAMSEQKDIPEADGPDVPGVDGDPDDLGDQDLVDQTPAEQEVTETVETASVAGESAAATIAAAKESVKDQKAAAEQEAAVDQDVNAPGSTGGVTNQAAQDQIKAYETERNTLLDTLATQGFNQQVADSIVDLSNKINDARAKGLSPADSISSNIQDAQVAIDQFGKAMGSNFDPDTLTFLGDQVTKTLQVTMDSLQGRPGLENAKKAVEDVVAANNKMKENLAAQSAQGPELVKLKQDTVIADPVTGGAVIHRTVTPKQAEDVDAVVDAVEAEQDQALKDQLGDLEGKKQVLEQAKTGSEQAEIKKTEREERLEKIKVLKAAPESEEENNDTRNALLGLVALGGAFVFAYSTKKALDKEKARKAADKKAADIKRIEEEEAKLAEAAVKAAEEAVKDAEEKAAAKAAARLAEKKANAEARRQRDLARLTFPALSLMWEQNYRDELYKMGGGKESNYAIGPSPVYDFIDTWVNANWEKIKDKFVIDKTPEGVKLDKNVLINALRKFIIQEPGDKDSRLDAIAKAKDAIYKDIQYWESEIARVKDLEHSNAKTDKLNELNNTVGALWSEIDRMGRVLNTMRYGDKPSDQKVASTTDSPTGDGVQPGSTDVPGGGGQGGGGTTEGPTNEDLQMLKAALIGKLEAKIQEWKYIGSDKQKGKIAGIEAVIEKSKAASLETAIKDLETAENEMQVVDTDTVDSTGGTGTTEGPDAKTVKELADAALGEIKSIEVDVTQGETSDVKDDTKDQIKNEGLSYIVSAVLDYNEDDQDEVLKAVGNGAYTVPEQHNDTHIMLQILSEHMANKENHGRIIARMTNMVKEKGAGESGLAKIQKLTPVGGINLNADHLTMNIKVDGGGMPLPVKFQDASMNNIQGLSPRIHEISPMTPANMPVVAEMLAAGGLAL